MKKDWSFMEIRYLCITYTKVADPAQTITAGRMCNGVEIDDQISWSSLSLSAKLVLVCWQVTFSNCAIATCLGLSTSSASPLFLEIVIWCGGFANASNCAEKWPFFAIDPEKVESCWLYCYLDIDPEKKVHFWPYFAICYIYFWRKTGKNFCNLTPVVCVCIWKCKVYSSRIEKQNKNQFASVTNCVVQRNSVVSYKKPR